MAALLRSNSVPKSTKILLGALVSISALILVLKYNAFKAQTQESFHNMQVPYLQLIPRYTLFYPWVVLTAIFAEVSVVGFGASGLVIFVASGYIEKYWGWKEVVKFVLIVGSITNFVTVLITIVTNIVRGDVAGMNQALGGGISYYFGFLVVFKQLIPEHNIVLFQGLVNFRVKHLPFTLLVLVSLWSLLISRSLYPAIPSINSFIISYSYLRFFQSFVTDPLLPITSASGANGETAGSSLITGDASDTFQLVEFFPSITKPYLSVVFDKGYELIVFLGIVTPFNDETVEQSNLRAQKRQEQANQAQKSVANSVAERRRQVALQVIEDRINKEAATSST
ncbi:eukaryotic integral membrane protein-domain-containing protein [Scheffersomyces xylosifermentans]|uniref:eukaryotic integral membrane protein-domain-containing protein n=1 Tax=Scheffersomyces xylosifermentans TaxID=1304137 RepID=UPI00315D161A